MNRKIRADPAETRAFMIQRRIILAIVILAIAFGVMMAIHRRWVCDDAFISYRYALNLVEGHGLVFNPGERVEGYSNFLWTLWCAVGLLLHLSCEQWTVVWGIAFYGLSLGLVAYHFLLVRRLPGITGVSLPIAVLLGALHQDWTIFATSGLETSLFTFLALLGYVLIAIGATGGKYRPITIGFVMTLCALTRPDGLIFAAVAGASLLWLTWPRWKPTLAFALAFAIPQVVYIAWRVWYYGDYFPNTYYAKSANLAWWVQGWHYLGLYLRKYAVLLLSVTALLTCLATVLPSRRDAGQNAGDARPRPPRAIPRLAVIAAAFGFTYTLAIVRIGGDFMFARMLIPATPFYLILIELGLLAVPWRGLLPQALISGAIALALVLPPYPMSHQLIVSGVANEWSYYGQYITTETQSATLRQYFRDLPVCVAFMGAEAHLMYRARIPIAIESEAGLTDRFIAHQPIKERGRVGHEKNAPIDYLVRQRKAHFVFHPAARSILKLDDRLVECRITLDGVSGYVLHWDPPVLAELAQRGARIDDLPAKIDRWLAQLDEFDDAQAADLYSRLKLMYFEHVNDPRREEALRRRLAHRDPPATRPSAG